MGQIWGFDQGGRFGGDLEFPPTWGDFGFSLEFGFFCWDGGLGGDLGFPPAWGDLGLSLEWGEWGWFEFPPPARDGGFGVFIRMAAGGGGGGVFIRVGAWEGLGIFIQMGVCRLILDSYPHD